MRTGSLPLEVETGRYRNIPLEERICKLCQAAPEDEMHFIIDCQFYNDLRYSMFKMLCDEYTDFYERPSVIKYILTMKSKHIDVISSTIVKMYLRRKSHIE